MLSHFITLIRVYSRRQRAIFFAKAIVWFCSVTAVFCLSETIQNKMHSLSDNFGNGFVQIMAYSFVLLLIFTCRIEFEYVKQKRYTTADYPFYQRNGINKKSFWLIRFFCVIPMALLSLLMSCVIGFSFINEIHVRVAFVVGWCMTFLLLCCFNGKYFFVQRRSGLIKVLRDRLLCVNRRVAILVFSLSGIDKALLFTFLLALGLALSFVGKTLWLTCWMTSWLSFCFALFVVDTYEKQIGFYQMNPQAYKQLIINDIGVSAFFCGANLLLQTIVFCFINSVSIECLFWPLVMFVYAVSNHTAIYLITEPMLPANRLSDRMAPILIPVVFFQIMPGVSVLLILIGWVKNKRKLERAVPWGDKNVSN